ncbi:MAG: ribosome maturation factor RimM [Muribaculaceae bacterium]|nr:ribosome maturation factor RimM [Muribaculaceae bacterium]
MITLKELYPIGYVAKTHVIKGELNVSLDTEFNPEDFKFLVFEVDGIFVPFPILGVRGRGANNRLVSVEGVLSDSDARALVGKTVYVLQRELKAHPDWNEEEEGMYLSDMIGFEMVDENSRPVGKIIGFNDDTSNWLLEIEMPDGRKVFVPYVEEWIVGFDPENRTISVNLPNGLIE